MSDNPDQIIRDAILRGDPEPLRRMYHDDHAQNPRQAQVFVQHNVYHLHFTRGGDRRYRMLTQEDLLSLEQSKHRRLRLALLILSPLLALVGLILLVVL